MSIDGLRLKLREKPYLWVYIAGTLLVFVCSIWWWSAVYLGPKHVFWSMVGNSLSAGSVVLKTEQSNGGDSLEQRIHIDTATAGRAHSVTTLKQSGTEVKTEIIGTKDADYTRYLSINSNSKADISKVKGVWSKSDGTQQTGTQSSAHQLYAQAVLGIGLPLGSTPVPVGGLTPKQRQVLYDFIRKERVYSPDFSGVKKEHKHNRLLYTYDVTIQAILYVRMMQIFAKDLGLTELEAVNPNVYQDNPTIKVSLTVDALSHQLASVNFKELGYSQHYESYGLPLTAGIPRDTISAAELQKRLGEIGRRQ